MSLIASPANGRLDTSRAVILGAALWDLIAVAPLAFPFTARLELAFLNQVTAFLGLYGQIPEMADGQLLFVNMAGCSALVWIAYRILAYRPAFLGAEMWIRCVFALLLGYYAAIQTVSGIVGVFAFTEAAWAGVCYWALRRAAKRSGPAGAAASGPSGATA